MSDTKDTHDGPPHRKLEGEKTAGLSPSGSFLILKGARFKKWIVVIQAITVAIVAAYGATRSTGETDARIGYNETTKHLRTLQSYAKANDKEIEALRREITKANNEVSMHCKAEVHAIRLYVTGYLLALSNRSPIINRREDRKTKAALRVLLKQSAANGVKPSDIKILRKSIMIRKRPKLKSPPPSLDELLQKQNMSSLKQQSSAQSKQPAAP